VDGLGGGLNKRILWFLPLILILVSLLSSAFPPSVKADPGWYNTGWAHRKKITINFAQVAGSLSNFPVMVNLTTDAGLAAYAQDDGDDILFTAADEVTKLSHDIEKFNGTTGQLVAWVKVPALSATVNTVIYMYYGNSSAASQRDANGTWDSNEMMVQHMGDAVFTDSTVNHNNGTNTGTSDIAGQAGQARSFNGSSNSVNWSATSFNYNYSNTFTLDFWLKTGTYGGYLISKGDANDGYSVTIESDGDITVYLRATGNSHVISKRVNANVKDNAWHHVVITYDGSRSVNGLLVYADGSQPTTQSSTNTVVSGDSMTTTFCPYLGRKSNTASWYTGSLDEVRISNSVRSAAWTTTEFRNEKNPGTFYSLSAEENVPVLPAVTTDNATLVEETTATLHGTLVSDGGEACSYRFEYDINSGEPYSFNTPWTGNITSGQSFSVNITGLSKGTIYYLRAEVRNIAGTVNGVEKTLLTKPEAPVSVNAVVVSHSQIDLSWTKGEGAQNTLVKRKTGSYPADRNDGVTVYFNTGTSAPDTGLTPSTTYYYRLWSEVSGEQWSDNFIDTSAVTNAAPPSLPAGTTDNATLVEETTATFHGTLVSDGGQACSYRFEYDNNSGEPYSFNTPWTGSITSGQSFSTNVSGLSRGTKYYVRAEVRNIAGTANGLESNFLTKPEAPGSGSANATAASDTQIDLSWIKGEGAQKTLVKRQTGGYPADRNAGVTVYFDTGTSVSDTGLTPATVYYYRLWSQVSGSEQWSDNYVDISAATSNTPPPPPPVTVGGTVFHVDKVQLLMPYIILILVVMLETGLGLKQLFGNQKI
jgi:hypothetical protein